MELQLLSSGFKKQILVPKFILLINLAPASDFFLLYSITGQAFTKWIEDCQKVNQKCQLCFIFLLVCPLGSAKHFTRYLVFFFIVTHSVLTEVKFRGIVIWPINYRDKVGDKAGNFTLHNCGVPQYDVKIIHSRSIILWYHWKNQWSKPIKKSI